MLNFKFIRYSVANLTHIICLFLCFTVLVSLYYNDGQATMYITYVIILAIFSYLLKYKIQISDIVKLRTPDLFFTTSLIWFYCIFVCMFPYIYLANFSFADAFFEMSSGVTTTGASVIPSLNSLPISLLFWRSITQWLGGVGFIVVAVLILPNLNSGGMKLFRTESSDTEEKTVPHYRKIAHMIMWAYLVLTIIAVLIYCCSGMTFIDGIQYAFTSVATGGFTPTDDPFVEILTQYKWVMVIIFLAALPLQVLAINIVRRQPWKIFYDRQILVYTMIILGSMVVVSISRLISDPSASGIPILDVFKESLFNVLNISTSLGYTISDFWEWGSLSFLVFILLSIIGGCSGSTAAGLKIFRFNILCLFVWNQFKISINPNVTTKVTYNNQKVGDDDLKQIMFFFIIYAATFMLMFFLYVIAGLDLGQAASSLMTTLTNAGAWFGYPVSDVGDFASQTDFQKIIGSFAMILGRLEFTTFYVLLIPKFWSYS